MLTDSYLSSITIQLFHSAIYNCKITNFYVDSPGLLFVL